MALVVFLKGLNVGGHRTLRPSRLAQQLAHLGTVNIGAAGTFVIRRPVSRARLRGEFARRLPFEVEIMICEGSEIIGLTARDSLSRRRPRQDVVPFVSVLSGPPRSTPPMPMSLPSKGRWLLRILAREGRFVLGVHRRHMRVIGHLGRIDTLFGTPATTRGWRTMAAIAAALTNDATGRPGELRRERRAAFPGRAGDRRRVGVTPARRKGR